MPDFTVLPLLLLAGSFFALWALSLRLRDSSIVDLAWGPAFALVFWSTLAVQGASPRGLLVGALLSAWATRLAGYLAWRNLGHGEDRRYTFMRSKFGQSWWWRSLFIVFGLQAALVWVVSWPVRAVAAAPFTGWSAVDLVATLLVLTGLAFETVGDVQLARFKKTNPGQIMNRGLWRYTRHPNYFGDFLVWWGFGVFALVVGEWMTLLGPVVMSVLLLRVSGKALLEKTMKKRPGYAEYLATTSGFFPWFPSKAR